MTASNPKPTTETARALMRERDDIHRRAVSVLAHGIGAMTDANRLAAGRTLAERLAAPDQVRAMSELSDLARDGAEFTVKSTPLIARLMGATSEMVKATTPTDRASYVMGWNAALTFVVTAFARPWVSVAIDVDPPAKTEPAKADRLAKLLEELGVNGQNIGVEVVEVDLGRGPALGEPDLASEVMAQIRRVLGSPVGSAGAKPGQLLNVLRVKVPYDPPSASWCDEDGAPFDLRKDDVVHELYTPTAEVPDGRTLLNKRTGQRAPFSRPSATWREVFEVTKVAFGGNR